MLYRELGTTGIRASALGLGTWAIGGACWDGTNILDAQSAVKQALDDGITLIETAPLYGFGFAEELLARAWDDHRRDGVVIAGKVGLTWHNVGRRYLEIEGRTIYRSLHPSTLRTELEDSLQRLRTDYLDLFITHLPDPATPIADTMGELLRLKAEGKIRAIGVANVTIAQLEEYLAVGPVDVVEQAYNMLDRWWAEETILPFCRERQIAVLSYATLAHGLLTGTLHPHERFAPGDQRAADPRFSAVAITRTNIMLDQFISLRKKYGLNQAQLTIAWTISRPGITCALAGARNSGQVADLVPGGSTLISPEDLALMDRIIDEMGPDTMLPRAA